jgi:hypothetical protein
LKYIVANFLSNIFSKASHKSPQRIEFVSYGREGAVLYREGLNEIRFYMEFGGNDVVFYLSIPSTSEWENTTGFSLQERNRILTFVATETQKYQAPLCNYRIEDKAILFEIS